MRLKDLIRPAFSGKKYFLAHDVLKVCCGNTLVMTNSPNEPHYLSEKIFSQTYLASNFLLGKKPKDSLRLIEVVDLLEKNGHLIANRNPNLYQYSITPTKAGERAFHSGYYLNVLYKSMAIVIGAPAVVAIIGYISKWL